MHTFSCKHHIFSFYLQLNALTFVTRKFIKTNMRRKELVPLLSKKTFDVFQPQACLMVSTEPRVKKEGFNL